MEGRIYTWKVLSSSELKSFLSDNRHIINISELDRLSGFKRSTIASKLNGKGTNFYPHQIETIHDELTKLRNTLNQYLNENN
jgi:hypothetical protein